MTEITGVETIIGLVGSPPKEIEIERKIVEKGTSLMREWNHKFLAFIPYCYLCKEVLNWYSPPEEGFIFRCPKCDRKWRVV